MLPDKHIERRIIIGLIVSDHYIKEMAGVWEPEYLQSSSAQRLASWCLEYYEKYDKAPGKDIEGIYFQKLKANQLDNETAAEIEEDILPELSDEYDREQFNTAYLMDQTRQYFKERKLTIFAEQVKAITTSGDIDEAEKIASDYSPINDKLENDLDLNSVEAQTRICQAFSLSKTPVLKYPGALGALMNDQLVRGGFIGFQGPEKRGKSFLLMDMAIRGTKQGANVAFFQAGDMTEDQMLRRICISIAQRSDKAKYCKEMLVPCLDCARNFTNECERPERTGFRGVNEGGTPESAFGFLWGKAIEGTLPDVIKENAGYEPCKLSRCPGFIGTVWYKIAPQCNPLTVDEAQATVINFFKPKGKVVKRRRGSFKLSTHVNGTLTVSKIRGALKRWEQDDGFVPDIILADYADLIEDPTADFRHKQNQIWKGFRGLSQEYHALMITATQADAASYEHDTISLKHFSEDKRKYSHVTAMYGLNQDTKGTEKKMKLMRINELLVREDEHDASKQIYILQCLQKGLPIISSFNTFKVNE